MAKVNVFEITYYKDDLAYLSKYALKYEIIETIDEKIGFLRIRIELNSNYDLTCFAVANSECGFDKGKAQWLKGRLVVVDANPAIEQSIDDKIFKTDFQNEIFQREVSNV
jgi:hypothetical protein